LPPGDTLENELKGVFEKAALRSDRMGEILSQVTIPYPFFAMVLNLQPGRHRYIFELLAAAFNLAGAAGQVFKHHFRVARPSDRTPLIQPVLQTPGHGSYPAGHATQCHLAKAVLVELLTAGAETSEQLERLANRIGENRLVAGLHYPADIVQGKVLGEALALHFIAMAKVNNSSLQWLWKKALDEK
jgi:membrane-associated phospholipid phosphatase